MTDCNYLYINFDKSNPIVLKLNDDVIDLNNPQNQYILKSHSLQDIANFLTKGILNHKLSKNAFVSFGLTEDETTKLNIIDDNINLSYDFDLEHGKVEAGPDDTETITGSDIGLSPSKYTQREVAKLYDDIYGNTFSYIHFKFGDCVKQYFFSDWLRNAEPDFVSKYETYFKQDRKTHSLLVVKAMMNECLSIWKKYKDEKDIQHRLFLYRNIDDTFLDSETEIKKYINEIKSNEEIDVNLASAFAEIAKSIKEDKEK